GTAYQLMHVVCFDPQAKSMNDWGVIAVKNKDYFDFTPTTGSDGKPQPKPFSNGFVTLPDGALVPQYGNQGAIVAHDGAFYVRALYPHTILRVEPPTNAAPMAKP